MFISISISVFLKKTILLYQIPALQVIVILQGATFAVILPFMMKMKFKFFKKKALTDNILRNILYTFGLWLLYSSLKYIPINVNVGIQFLVPVCSVVLAIFILKERNSIFIWLSFFACIIGAVVIRGGFAIKVSEFEMRAYILLASFVVVRSFGNILNRQLAIKYNTRTLVFYSHTIMFFLSFVAMLLFRSYRAIPIDIFLSLCGFGLMYLIEYCLIFRAFKYCSVLTIQPLEFSKMIYAIILSNIFLNEAFTKHQIVGSILIALGFMSSIFDKRVQRNRNTKTIKKQS